MHKKTCNRIVTQVERSQQLCLWEPSIAKVEGSPYLQIASIPFKERITPKENRYILLIQPYGIRATAGQFTGDEAYQIAQNTKEWDWSLDANGRLECLNRLEELCDRICKRFFEGGEA